MPPLLSTVLLGHRVEVVYRDKHGEREEVGVVVGVAHEGLTLTKAAGYNDKLGVWLPPRPRDEWRREREVITRVTVLHGAQFVEGAP